MRPLLIATHNPGKVREYRALLADLELQVLYLDDLGITADVAETGTTFAENATLKAQSYAAMSGLLTWSDDSGLEVDALGGRPGVYSARYGGPGLSDHDRLLHLLDELRAYPPAGWTARFRCVVALAEPHGTLFTADDQVEGIITDPPRGQHGFGYDPIFYMPAYGATMAELDPALKNRVSHRAKAAQAAKLYLARLLQTGAPPHAG
jgi:XTP/dITP diphosphohydrolase